MVGWEKLEKGHSTVREQEGFLDSINREGKISVPEVVCHGWE